MTLAKPTATGIRPVKIPANDNLDSGVLRATIQSPKETMPREIE
jgi:hypothetical protein